MLDLPDAILHLDQPTPGTPLVAGATVVLGWLVPKPGHLFTDLRLRAGGRVFPGILGLPRPDLAEYFHLPRSPALAGFEVAVELPAGRVALVIEACAIDGTWRALHALELDVAPAAAPAPLPTGVPVRAGEFAAATLVALRRAETDPAAFRSVAAETPAPHYLRHAHLPLHGNLDEPQAWAGSIFGQIPIAGWLLHETRPIRRVLATADLQALQVLESGRATPFLPGALAAAPGAAHCGFRGYLDVPAQLERPVAVRVYAETDDGQWHLAFVVRITTTDEEFAKQPFGRRSPAAFLRTAWALRRAMHARGLALEGRNTGGALLQAWRDYARESARPGRTPPTAAPPGAAPTAPPALRRVHLCTHNLAYEGAPLFLLELARHVVAETGATLTVTSGCEGPLRAAFAELGATVQVVDPAPLLTARSESEVAAALAGLGRVCDVRPDDLVVANTVAAYWAVHLARRAGRPSLLYIHESTTPRRFFRGLLPGAALQAVEAAFAGATRISYLTEATRRYYRNLADPGRECLHPGWIDIAAIDRHRAAADRNVHRARLGIAPDRRLVLNPGTVCDRKGQHVFARAVDLLWRIDPTTAAGADFVMVGARATAYDRSLADFVAELGRPNLRLVPETPAIHDWFAAADVGTCSSFEESFPRVVLEAMAFGLPLVASGVHGIPEIARDGREALLVPPGDTAALAAAWRRLLTEPETAGALARAARDRVVAEFASTRVLPRHVELLRQVAGSGA